MNSVLKEHKVWDEGVCGRYNDKKMYLVLPAYEALF